MSVWKQVLGYEGLYLVSDDGFVKREQRKIVLPNGAVGIIKERVLKRHIGRDGYLYAILTKNNITKRYAIHRLVAIAFIPNPLNLPEVNHKDEIRSNPCADNLEWCDRKYNCNYGNRAKKYSKSRGRSVDRYSLDGEYIDTWDCESHFTREFGYKGKNLIIKVCNHYNGYSTAYGYKWKYHDDDSDFNTNYRGIPVIQYSLDGDFIKKYPNAVIASNETGISLTGINKCARGVLQTSGGYIWKRGVKSENYKNVI